MKRRSGQSIRRNSYLSLGMAVAACTGEAAPIPAAANPDSTPQVIETQLEADAAADSIRSYIGELEAQLAELAGNQRVALLLELGRALTVFSQYTYVDSEHEPYAEANGFVLNQERWLYTGRHFQIVVDSFPNHELADDAGYELTKLEGPGDCDGYTECNIRVEWRVVRPFLERFPGSPLVQDALEDFMTMFEQELQHHDVDNPREWFEPELVKGHLIAFDSVAERLEEPYRTQARSRSDRIWMFFGGRPR